MKVEDVEKAITDLRNDREKQLEELSEATFTNKLDYLHDKAKLEDYCHICDNMLVSLNKSSNIQEFILDAQKLIDANISTGKIKDGKLINEGELLIARRGLPKPDDTGGESISEDQITKKGRINGRIVAYTEIRNIINDSNTDLAKDNAKQHGHLES